MAIILARRAITRVAASNGAAIALTPARATPAAPAEVRLARPVALVTAASVQVLWAGITACGGVTHEVREAMIQAPRTKGDAVVEAPKAGTSLGATPSGATAVP